MKKLLTAIVLCCVLTAMIAVPASAAAFTESTYNINYETAQISISADTALPLTRVTLVVLNPGKELSGVSADDTALQHQRELVTDAEGKLSYTFTANFAAEPTESVVLKAYAKLPANAMEKIADIYYASPTERVGYLNKLKGSTSDIQSLFGNETAKKCLGLTDFAPFADVDAGMLAASMQGNFSTFPDTAKGFVDACSYVREFIVLEHFNQNKADKVFAENGSYLMEDAFSFDKYDQKNNTTVWTCYNNLLSASAKQSVRSSLFGKSIESPEALYKKFAESTVLIGLTNPAETGYGHVEQLLTDNNSALIGFTVSGTITGDIEASIAAASGFSTVEELKGFVNGLLAGGGDNGGSGNTGNTGSTGNGGSSGGKTAGGSVIISNDYPVKPAVPEKTVIFNDVDEDHWAVKAVSYLKSKGIVNGTGNNEFLPDSPVTREEFVKMIFAIADAEVKSSEHPPFEDTPADQWYAPYIATAVEQGYINGISEKEFGVGQYATRQDICTIISRVLGLEAVDVSVFNDRDSIADYAENAITGLYKNGIVSGYPDGSFRPTANCTRAEAASIIYNACKYMEVK